MLIFLTHEGVGCDPRARITDEPHDLLFEAQTPLGFRVRVRSQQWKLIVTAKHPVMAGREGLVRTVLEATSTSRSYSFGASGSA
jgi:hypothetical protein